MTVTLFVADDHGVVREGIRFLLEAQADFKVVGDADTGHGAVQQVARLRPDVVIMDIALPDMSGIDAAEEIHRQLPATQIVILSMHADTEYVVRALRAGALGYVLKEAVGGELVAAIRAVHAGRRHLSQKVANLLIDEYLSQRKASDIATPLGQLTSREREVVQLVADGKTSSEIAALLSLSPKTVETYRSRAMQKLGVTDLASLVKFAIQHDLTSLA